MAQAIVGKRSSIPKICRISGDDSKKLVYKNVGNNHAYPFIWADQVTISGTSAEVVVASGISFHGFDLASYATVVVTPLSDPGDVRIYVDKDTASNVITLKASGALSSSTDFDLMLMLGDVPDVDGIYCTGKGNPAPSLP